MTYELPPELQTEEGRREFFRQARRKLKDDAGGRGLGEDAEPRTETGREYEFDVERIVVRVQGREGWRREAHRQLEHQRWEDRDSIPSSREERLSLSECSPVWAVTSDRTGRSSGWRRADS